MEKFIDLLKAAGATNVTFTEKDNENDTLRFELCGKVVTLCGRWHNDSTGGIDAYVENA